MNVKYSLIPTTPFFGTTFASQSPQKNFFPIFLAPFNNSEHERYRNFYIFNDVTISFIKMRQKHECREYRSLKNPNIYGVL